MIAHYQTREGNQGGNQGDDSTGQHYSVTGRTLHVLIRAGETEPRRDGQMEGGRDLECAVKTYRNIFKDKLTEQIRKKDTEERLMKPRPLLDSLSLSEFID